MKKKIKETCLDCYGNNPFIQNEGLQSYYNMLPKDDCGKCKDTPYPNPGQGNCCEEPDHSGIYTLGCIEGYGTKCDPLRIKENCLPSGSSDCDCEVELECTNYIPGSCDYRVEGIDLGSGDNIEYETIIIFAETFEMQNGWVGDGIQNCCVLQNITSGVITNIVEIKALELNNASSVSSGIYTISGSQIATMVYDKLSILALPNYTIVLDNNILTITTNNDWLYFGLTNMSLSSYSKYPTGEFYFTWTTNGDIANDIFVDDYKYFLILPFKEPLYSFEVNINGEWEDETDNVSEEGTWSLSNTTNIVTEWRYRDSEGNPGEPTPIVGDCTEPIEETYSICEKLSDHEERIIELEENGGGGEVSASNGTYNDEGTLKLGTNLTEDTDIPNPDNKSFRIGNPGDAINLNANIPIEFGDFALTYTGFDYVSGTHQSFSGILKGVTFAPLDMEDKDIVGTFTIAGDPFNVTTPDGQIFIDGIWYENGEVVMNKIVFNFTSTGISMNANIHDKSSQNSYFSGNNGELNRIAIEGNNNLINDHIEGENGAISRGINNPTTGKAFIENITDTKQEITVDNIELNTTEYSLTSEGSKTGYTDSIIKIIGKNIADGIGIFLGNIWRNVFVKTGLVIFGGGADYINGFDIIGEGSSVGGGVSGESLGSGTGLYLNGKTNNSGTQYPALRVKGNNIGTFDDIIIDPINSKLSILNIPINTQQFVYGENSNGRFIKFDLADYLPKTLVEFRGSASYTGTTSESLLYASAAIPSTAWRENGNYILTILGVCQAAQTQNAVIKIYLNTANTLNGSEILINQSHVLTDNTYTPNGGNVLAIHLPIFKNTIELLTNKGNSTIANINTGSIFSSNINMTYAKIRTKVTPNFTGNLYLIITTTQSAGSVTTEINNIIFKEI